MKILKYILYSLAGLLVIYILLCLAGPKKLSVEKSVDIEAPFPVVFNLVNNLENTALWASWTLSDTSMNITYNNLAEGVGASSKWTSEKEGNGSQKIVESEKYSRVRTELEFEGFSGISHAEFNLSKNGNKTHTVWSFDGSGLPFLFRGVMLVSGANKALGKAYKEGLENLKRLSEDRAKNNNYLGYTINEVVLEEKNFIMTRQVVKMENVQQFYSSNLGQLFNKVQKSGLAMDGMPCGLFFKWDSPKGSTDMAAAIPVSEPIDVDGALSYQIPSKVALTLDYYGSYAGLGKAHTAIETFMKDRGYFEDPPQIEEYITDPGEEKDPDKLLTRITYYYTN